MGDNLFSILDDIHQVAAKGNHDITRLDEAQTCGQPREEAQYFTSQHRGRGADHDSILRQEGWGPHNRIAHPQQTLCMCNIR